MKNRFYKAVEQASETRALFVLLVVLTLRAWRAIPNLRPHHLLVPITLTQIILFIFTAITTPHLLIQNIAIGNLLIVGIANIPTLFQRPKPKFHWVNNENNKA